MTEDELLGAARQAWPTRVMVLVLFCAVGSPKVDRQTHVRIIARSVTDGIGRRKNQGRYGCRDTVGDHETDSFSLERTQQLANLAGYQAAMSRAVAAAARVTEGQVADSKNHAFPGSANGIYVEIAVRNVKA